jgi:IS30 family transposase
MANVLKMAIVQSIRQLHASGWSQRRIARALEIDRGTVARHLRAPPPDSKAAILPAGSTTSSKRNKQAATLPRLALPNDSNDDHTKP